MKSSLNAGIVRTFAPCLLLLTGLRAHAEVPARRDATSSLIPATQAARPVERKPAAPAGTAVQRGATSSLIPPGGMPRKAVTALVPPSPPSPPKPVTPVAPVMPEKPASPAVAVTPRGSAVAPLLPPPPVVPMPATPSKVTAVPKSATVAPDEVPMPAAPEVAKPVVRTEPDAPAVPTPVKMPVVEPQPAEPDGKLAVMPVESAPPVIAPASAPPEAPKPAAPAPRVALRVSNPELRMAPVAALSPPVAVAEPAAEPTRLPDPIPMPKIEPIELTPPPLPPLPPEPPDEPQVAPPELADARRLFALATVEAELGDTSFAAEVASVLSKEPVKIPAATEAPRPKSVRVPSEQWLLKACEKLNQLSEQERLIEFQKVLGQYRKMKAEERRIMDGDGR